ncbi:Uma2 family endonuclease [Bradyrhizobium japonicum]|uniref:Uma2 family endonuclease n=1 Tax=Bradyrhizobium japonicum TaxID=375 RepID=UPI003BB50ACF
MTSGARLGWLLDPQTRRVHVYRPSQAAEVLENPDVVSGEDVLKGFELQVLEVWG